MKADTIDALDAELSNARSKFPKQDRHRLGFALVEEMLEWARAVNDGEGIQRENAELLQVVAVAIRIIEET